MQKIIESVRSSLAIQVLLGFALGIFAGVFFGEITSSLEVLGTAYIRLFQMPVIPYMLVSLIAGLGKLNFKTAKSLGINAGLTLLFLWLIIIFILIVYPLGFPNWQSASFFSESLVEPPQKIDFVELFLPSNPFSAMANTIIPSVVTFSIAIGLSLILVDQKQTVIEVMEKLSESLLIITRFVAKLSPIGVFAIAANAAGTLRLEDFGRLQIHIILHGLISLILSFWVLPGLISVLTPIKYKDIIKEIRAALVTAFAIANLLVVLPILVDACKKLVDNIRPQTDPDADQQEIEDSPLDVIIPASFNFPNMGKLLSLAFIPFAAWYVGTPLTPSQYPTFVATGVPVFFADGTLGTTFMLSLFKIPTNMLSLYITVEVFTARFGTLLAGMYTVALGIISTCAMQGLIRFNKRKLIRFTIISFLVTILSLGSVHFIFSYIFPQEYNKNELLTNLKLFRVRDPQASKVYPELPPRRQLAAETEINSRLDLIKNSKILRVGYLDNAYPLSYINNEGELVGMDVEMSHILSKDLGVNLEFVPLGKDDQGQNIEQDLLNFTQLANLLDNEDCDLIIPGGPLFPSGEEEIDFSHSFTTRSVGFFVRSELKSKFSSWQSLQAEPNLRIAIPTSNSYYIAKIRGLLPQAELTTVNKSITDFLEQDFAPYDAFAFSAETASALTLLYPSYAVAVPQPAIKFPVAYILPENTSELSDVVNVWLKLKQEDGTIDSLYNYWVKGDVQSTLKPRWSIIRDVLHWID
ncbi:Na+/H+ dicarboxylate symporter [Xenococcus sp. PCC 7305]|uniref:cation:dicarboxylate symporter family transporter n=1 Tax=Xenococcus sp. PCC 7305 TaxID=102125 RepID=UPI0002ACEC1D|nr:cation:dicarboxylase symporter family transporter [Xenococcus sp. PCC 7305]ELS05037.1 Na+/H+ dicarboxylate symporter [Xenococcus sp. PCC 7305]